MVTGQRSRTTVPTACRVVPATLTAADGPHTDLHAITASGGERGQSRPAAFRCDSLRVGDEHWAEIQAPPGDLHEERPARQMQGLHLATEQGARGGGVPAVEGETHVRQEGADHAVPVGEETRTTIRSSR